MSSLCVKFQPSSTPPSDKFWWGVVLLVLVTGVKQSQLLVLRLRLEYDNNLTGTWGNVIYVVYMQTSFYLWHNSANISVLLRKRMILASRNTLLLAIMLNNWKTKNIKNICFCNNRILEKVVYLDSFVHFIHFWVFLHLLWVVGQAHTEDNSMHAVEQVQPLPTLWPLTPNIMDPKYHILQHLEFNGWRNPHPLKVGKIARY